MLDPAVLLAEMDEHSESRLDDLRGRAGARETGGTIPGLQRCGDSPGGVRGAVDGEIDAE